MEKVRVTADPNGLVIIPSRDKPLYGYIRLEQTRGIVNAKGKHFKPVSVLYHGLLRDLRKLGWKEGQELNGKIILKEQLNPFDPDHPENDYKMAGSSGVILRVYGEPIYRKFFYSSDPNAKDSLLTNEDGSIMSHTNKDEVKEAYEMMKIRKSK